MTIIKHEPSGLQECDLCRSPYVVERWRGHRRCEKHRGRLPCCIDGCGRTFALKPGENYSWVTICGQHWRMAPKRLRDLVTAIRRKANRLAKKDPDNEWPLKLRQQHSRVWHKCRLAIIRALEGDMDVKEIHRMMGWDD